MLTAAIIDPGTYRDKDSARVEYTMRSTVLSPIIELFTYFVVNFDSCWRYVSPTSIPVNWRTITIFVYNYAVLGAADRGPPRYRLPELLSLLFVGGSMFSISIWFGGAAGMELRRFDI